MTKQRRRRSATHAFAATTVPARRHTLGPIALWVTGPIAYWVALGRGPAYAATARVWAIGCLVAGAAWYYRAIRVERTVIRLDAGELHAGKVTLTRSKLRRVPGRWVDAVYGTTVGMALMLEQGGRSVTLGCRGALPPSDGIERPGTTSVELVLSAEDFQRLLRALGGERPRRARVVPETLTVGLVPSPLSARGLLGGAWPLLVFVVLAELIGLLSVFVLHLPEAVLAGLAWLLAAGGAYALLRAGRRPRVAHQRLRIQGRTIAWLSANDATSLATCELDDLAVERYRHTIHSRFGSSVQQCLVLRFPGGRRLYFGLAEGTARVDATWRRAWLAPSLLIGRGEWNQLAKFLPRPVEQVPARG
jgi:hypothetical protein